jgi:hypothetical protein
MSVTTNDPRIVDALAIPGWYEKAILSHLSVDGSGCRLWTRGISEGYGRVTLPSQEKVGVHRVVWIAERGLPAGMVLDHDGPNGCKVRHCATPEHLMVATTRQNTLTGSSFAAVNSRKVKCSRGHILTAENLRRRDRGGRDCLTCHREAVRESRRLAYRAALALGMDPMEYRREFGLSRQTSLEVLLMTAIAA